ncbi:hypothetical protein WMY93_032598 [Mugilogobius chulae]|uniref:Uncharacterized protein n=1 Tax=Mugilogobius chulae TaxID=88201 RepID=A0AAW0MJB6_9GOBI
MVAREFTPLLKLYKTDKPVLPFMCSELRDLLHNLMKKFIKPCVMTSAVELTQVDVCDPENHVDVTRLKVGLETEQALEKFKKKNPSDQLRLEFGQNCLLFLSKTISKLLENSPLKSLLKRSLSVLDPRILLQNKDLSSKNMSIILRLLLESGHIDEKCCNDALREFRHFCDLMSSSEAFCSFDPQSARLDEFYHEHLSNKEEFHNLWVVIKRVLVLTHGQGSAERVFSVNKKVLVESLKMDFVIAQRIICDHVQHVGGLCSIDYSKELLMSAADAKEKYERYCEDQLRLQRNKQNVKKRKRFEEEVREIRMKKQKVEEDIKDLLKSADKKAEKAEKQGNLSFLSSPMSFVELQRRNKQLF